MRIMISSCAVRSRPVGKIFGELRFAVRSPPDCASANPPLRCAASAPVHGRIEPVGDDLRHLVAVLFQHHHVSVTVDAKVGDCPCQSVKQRRWDLTSASTRCVCDYCCIIAQYSANIRLISVTSLVRVSASMSRMRDFCGFRLSAAT